MKYMQIFDTDMYELTMIFAGLHSGDADDMVGFEAYFRHPKKVFNDNLYYFSGEQKIHDLMKNIKKDLDDPEIGKIFLSIIRHLIPDDKYEECEKRTLEFFLTASKDFEYFVYPEGQILPAYVPAVQFKGPKYIGMLLETQVMATINGPTGLLTQKMIGTNKNLDILDTLVNSADPINEPVLSEYFNKMEIQAQRYRGTAAGKILLDASFRRSPSIAVAMEATKICHSSGYDGSANVGSSMRGDVPSDFIGGTMAHLYIMSQAYDGENHEIEAFKKWDAVFPRSTMLPDTYNIMTATDNIIKAELHPKMLRIDSSPLDELSFAIRRKLDSAGYKTLAKGGTGIFISGDLTPEIISDFVSRGVPFDALMSGTAMVGVDIGGDVNAGYVYKVVEVEKDGEKYYPEKKANGKGSISGLKRVWKENGVIKTDNRPPEGEWGIYLD